MVGRDDVEEAAGRLAGWIRRTPVLQLPPETFGLAGPLTVKLELTQHTGSFKPRGAFNLLLARDVPDAGVVAASGGNFGLGIAYAAGRLGHRATVFIPTSSPAAKVETLHRLGADVRVGGEYYAEALEASAEFAGRTGALVAHAYDQPEVVAGQGTCGRELEEQADPLDTVVVVVGGAGLIGGTAAWFQERVRIVGVESEGTASLSAALAAGGPVDTPISGLAADSLGARRVGDIGFDLAQRWVEQVVTVSDDAIREAQRTLWQATRLVVEPGTAAGLAALLVGAYEPAAGEHVGLFLCGANTDPAQVASA